MSTTIHIATEVDEYLAAVAGHLADLPPSDRQDLLDDLAQHLAEVAAEPGPSLVERLGSPADYAAELLASAGMAPDPAAARRRRVRDATRYVQTTAPYRAVAAVLPELRPAWWVLRGLIAAWLVVDMAGSDNGFLLLFVPYPSGNRLAGIILTVAAVAGSVALGRRGARTKWARALVVGANVGLLVFGVVHAHEPPDLTGGGFYSFPPARPDCFHHQGGEHVDNFYAFDAEGKPIDRFTLYDTQGRPVTHVCEITRQYEVDGRMHRTEIPTDANGRVVSNAYPRRKVSAPITGFDSTGPEQAEPTPAIAPPRLATTTSTTSTTSTTTP